MTSLTSPATNGASPAIDDATASFGQPPVELVGRRLGGLCQMPDVILKQRHGERDDNGVGLGFLESENDKSRAGLVDHETGFHRAGAAGADNYFGHAGSARMSGAVCGVLGVFRGRRLVGSGDIGNAAVILGKPHLFVGDFKIGDARTGWLDRKVGEVLRLGSRIVHVGHVALLGIRGRTAATIDAGNRPPVIGMTVLHQVRSAAEPWYDWGTIHVERMEGSCAETMNPGGEGPVRFVQLQWFGIHIGLQIGCTPKKWSH